MTRPLDRAIAAARAARDTAAQTLLTPPPFQLRVLVQRQCECGTTHWTTKHLRGKWGRLCTSCIHFHV